MRDLTNACPKPMLPVHGKPILEHIVEGLRGAKIEQICIITGFKADVIEQHFLDGKRLGVEVHYARQSVQDGTGKAPELAQPFVDGSPFLLTYGDILVKPQTYCQMRERFESGSFSGVVTVTGSEDVTKGGLLLFDDSFCLKRLVEKPTAEQLDQLRHSGELQVGQPVWYNAGIYIFKPALFDYTARLQKSPRGEFELTDAINDMATHGHRLAGLEIQGRWVDVRDPEVLAALEQNVGRE